MNDTRRSFITQSNIGENTEFTGFSDATIYLPNPNTSLEAQMAIVGKQANNLLGGAAVMENNPKFNR